MVRKSGQITIFDALIFFIIVIIATSVVYYAAVSFIKSSPKHDVSERLHQYTTDVMTSVLLTTINETNFTFSGEKKVIKGASVERLIYTYIDLSILNKTSGKYNLDNIRSAINDKFLLGVGETYAYVVYAYAINDKESSTLFLTNDVSVGSIDGLPEFYFTATKESSTGVHEVSINLYIWGR
ncbi:MAG: hypothetical protein AB1779_03845 [Candidatus Thermoplasmatota archaeon]